MTLLKPKYCPHCGGKTLDDGSSLPHLIQKNGVTIVTKDPKAGDLEDKQLSFDVLCENCGWSGAIAPGCNTEKEMQEEREAIKEVLEE